MLWRDIEILEELKFRSWARENYIPNDPILDVWHPVVRDECRKMNQEDRGEDWRANYIICEHILSDLNLIPIYHIGFKVACKTCYENKFHSVELNIRVIDGFNVGFIINGGVR